MIPIIDNGHGGVIGGKYQTPGKRSPKWNKGVLYEGAFNRWFVNRLIEKLDRAELPYYHVSPELRDVTLKTRVNRANEIAKTRNDVYFYSVHANAGKGTGIEGFTSVGKTLSDPISEVFLQDIQKEFSDTQVMRFDLSDGDRDKERNFYVLRNTICPAFLIEWGFMDHPVDYELLFDEKMMQRRVNVTFESMLKLYKI